LSSEPEIDPTPSIDNLRAALRLCFDSEQADRFAALVHSDTVDIASLGPVMHAARLSFEIQRWRSLLRRSATRPLLRPRTALPGTAALELALHLGLGLTASDLSRLTGRSLERVGQDLLQARLVIGSPMATPCEAFASLIGRQRDPVIDREQALSLMLHLGHCDRCRSTLDRVREIDETLLSEFRDDRAALGPRSIGTHRVDAVLARPVLLWVSLGLLGVVLLIAGAAGARVLRADPAQPVSLVLANSTTSSGSGWLLESFGNGEVDAVNVATGFWRPMITVPDGDIAQNFMSPDQKSIAQLTTSVDDGRPDQLRIYNLDGSVAHEWPLSNTQRVRIPLAWLNNSTMIMSQIPASSFGTSFAFFTTETDLQGSVILFNVNSGLDRTIFSRGARTAYPSPDGKFIAISRYALNQAGSVEVRPFDGKTLGQVVGTVNEGGFPIIWSRDSQRIYFTASHVLEVTPVPLNLGDRGIAGQPGFSYSIDSMGIDGNVHTVLDFPRGDTGNIASISPDGTRLIYVRGSSSVNGSWSFWQSTIDGKSPVQLAPADPGINVETVVWSPAGDPFLTSSEPFYLPQAVDIPKSVGPPSYVTMMIQHDRIAKTLIDQLTDPRLIGFIPDLVDPASTIDSTRSRNRAFGSPQQLPDLGGHLALTNTSRIGPGKNNLLLYDRVTKLTVRLNLTSNVASLPIGGGLDPSWLPDASGIVGVNQYTLQQGDRSRIAIYESGSVPVNGLVEFDPADLGSTSRATYRFPKLSPDGLHLSFFVVDGNTVSLWLAGRDRSTASVASWTLPANARIPAALVSEWVDNDTLVVAHVEDWTDGYPLRVVLERVRLSSNGIADLEPLVSWKVHGSEQGISIAELAISPNGSNLAARIEHFSGTNVERDRFDTIEVLSADDVSNSIELVRGKPGKGLSWAPDGMEIVAALDGQLTVMSSTGNVVTRVPTGTDSPSYPVWIRPNEIWFASGTGDQASVLRIVR
jgi:hypothetical protein